MFIVKIALSDPDAAQLQTLTVYLLVYKKKIQIFVVNMACISSHVVKKLYISSEIHIFHFILWKMSHSTTKPNKAHIRPAKTLISIHPVWSETSLSAWRKLGSLAIHCGDSEDSDQTGQMPSVIWFFDGHTSDFVLFCLRIHTVGSGSLLLLYHVSSSHVGGWGSIALVGHSSRSLLDLYTKPAGQGKLIVLVDSSPRSF